MPKIKSDQILHDLKSNWLYLALQALVSTFLLSVLCFLMQKLLLIMNHI